MNGFIDFLIDTDDGPAEQNYGYAYYYHRKFADHRWPPVYLIGM